MKKHLAAILCLALVVALSACAASPQAAPEQLKSADTLRVTEAVSAPSLETSETTAEAETQDAAEPTVQTEAETTGPQVSEDVVSAAEETATPAEESAAPTAPLQTQPTQTQPVPTAPPETEPPAPPETESPQPYGGVDIDLTIYSSTMLFSQTYNMLVDPTPYLGQVVRMRGSYIVYSDGARACLISDEGGCCQEGIHFALKEGVSYPEVGSMITVVGIFGTYYYNGVLYCHVYDAVLE